MSAEATLYSLLSAAPGVTALVSTRIYPDLVPEEKAAPYIGYERTSTQPIVAISGATLGEIVTLTLACWADTRIAAEALADAVTAALQTSVLTYVSRGSELDEPTGRSAATLDYQTLTQ